MRQGLTGVAIGTGVVLLVWLVESVVSGRDPLELHMASVAVWVVDALPIVLGLAMHDAPLFGIGSSRSGIVPPPQLPDRVGTPAPGPRIHEARRSRTPSPLPDDAPTPPTENRRRTPAPPVGTPPPVPRRLTPAPVQREATPPPIPRRLAQAPTAAPDQLATIPEGGGRTILVVDGTPEGPQVASWLDERGYEVVHVGEAASGSLAREAEHPSLAVVNGEGVGMQALIGELGRHKVPVVVMGGASLTLPQRAVRTLRPPTAKRLGSALQDLAVMGSE